MSETKPLKNNYLVMIGLGVFVCLVVLTIISLLDFRRDMRDTPPSSQASLAAATPNISVCPHCGTQSIPQCPYCASSMQGNNSRGIYFCPGCQQSVPAHCPYCQIPIQANTNTPTQPPVNQSQPVAFRYPGTYPGCLPGTLPAASQVAWPPVNNGPVQPNWLICPGCSYLMFHQSGIPIYGGKCPLCKTIMVNR